MTKKGPRINWSLMVPVTIAGGLLGGLGLLLYEVAQSDSASSEIQEYARVAAEQAQFELVDGATVLHTSTDDSLYLISHVFNFDMGYVLVNSRHALDNNYVDHSGSFLLADFADSALIDQARRAGCDAARKTVEELADFTSGSLVFSSRPESVDRRQAQAQSFLSNHCSPTPEGP